MRSLLSSESVCNKKRKAEAFLFLFDASDAFVFLVLGVQHFVRLGAVGEDKVVVVQHVDDGRIGGAALLVVRIAHI